MCTIPIRKINAISNAFAFQERFFIQSLSDKIGDVPMVEELHRHDFFFILVLQNASGEHEIDFKSYTVKDHTLFFIKPGQVHQLVLQPNSKGYLLHFSADAYHANNTKKSALLNKVANQDSYEVSSSYFETIFPLFTAIYEEFTHKKQGYIEIIRANLNILFTKLVRDFHNSNPTQNNYNQERLEAFLQLLETSIAHKKRVSEYAAMMNLSVYQLNNIVKSTLGKTCSEIIKEQIILEAKRYLLVTSNQISQIALTLGYEDISYFIRFFKKQTGYSPNSFRQNFK